MPQSVELATTPLILTTPAAGASGKAEAMPGAAIPFGQSWLIDHATAVSSAIGPGIGISVYDATREDPSALVTSSQLADSQSGIGFEGDWPNGLLVTHRVLAVFTGLPVGATGTFRAQYRVVSEQ